MSHSKNISNITDINTDPKKFGPVLWRIIHIAALNMSADDFIKFINLQIIHILCMDCRNHAIEYLKNNPPESYKNVYDVNGEFVGMFKWSWKFHNDVNIRLKHQLMDYNTAYALYSTDSQTCSDSCGN
jgi:hypothetical protein